MKYFDSLSLINLTNICMLAFFSILAILIGLCLGTMVPNRPDAIICGPIGDKGLTGAIYIAISSWEHH